MADRAPAADPQRAGVGGPVVPLRPIVPIEHLHRDVRRDLRADERRVRGGHPRQRRPPRSGAGPGAARARRGAGAPNGLSTRARGVPDAAGRRPQRVRDAVPAAPHGRPVVGSARGVRRQRGRARHDHRPRARPHSSGPPAGALAADARVVRAVSRVGALARPRVHVRSVRLRGRRRPRRRAARPRDPVRGRPIRAAREHSGADAPAPRPARLVDADRRMARIASAAVEARLGARAGSRSERRRAGSLPASRAARGGGRSRRRRRRRRRGAHVSPVAGSR